MKQLLTITISFLAITLAGCNFYTDIDADWNEDENAESSSCDQLRVLLDAEDDEGRKAELAAEYARCAGADPGDEAPDDTDCDGADGAENCPDDGHEDPTGGHDDPNCVDGQDCNVDPDAIDCQQVEVWVSGHTAEDALHFCADLNLSDERCHEIVSQCLGPDWTPGVDPDGGNSGANDPICDVAYNALADNNIDPDSLSSEEAYNLCMQTGMDGSQGFSVDESMCLEVSERCFSHSPDANPLTCETLLNHARSQGVQDPTSEQEAAAVYQQCLTVTSEDICDQLITCYGFAP